MKLEDLKRLEAEATPEKWVGNYPESGSMAVPVIRTQSGGLLVSTAHYGKMRENAAFITALRNNAKLMFAVIDAARCTTLRRRGKDQCGECAVCIALKALEEAP